MATIHVPRATYEEEDGETEDLTSQDAHSVASGPESSPSAGVPEGPRSEAPTTHVHIQESHHDLGDLSTVLTDNRTVASRGFTARATPTKYSHKLSVGSSIDVQIPLTFTKGYHGATQRTAPQQVSAHTSVMLGTLSSSASYGSLERQVMRKRSARTRRTTMGSATASIFSDVSSVGGGSLFHRAMPRDANSVTIFQTSRSNRSLGGHTTMSAPGALPHHQASSGFASPIQAPQRHQDSPVSIRRMQPVFKTSPGRAAVPMGTPVAQPKPSAQYTSQTLIPGTPVMTAPPDM